MQNDNYKIEQGVFGYHDNDEEVTLRHNASEKFNVVELLEHGFVSGDEIVFGLAKDSISTIVFVGKESECSIDKLKTALDKIYANGPIFDAMYIETILMELYKTIVISYK